MTMIDGRFVQILATPWTPICQRADIAVVLQESRTPNCTPIKYQFAIRAYHRLTMSFAYFNVWHIQQVEPGDFEKGLTDTARTDKD